MLVNESLKFNILRPKHTDGRHISLTYDNYGTIVGFLVGTKVNNGAAIHTTPPYKIADMRGYCFANLSTVKGVSNQKVLYDTEDEKLYYTNLTLFEPNLTDINRIAIQIFINASKSGVVDSATLMDELVRKRNFFGVCVRDKELPYVISSIVLSVPDKFNDDVSDGTCLENYAIWWEEVNKKAEATPEPEPVELTTGRERIRIPRPNVSNVYSRIGVQRGYETNVGRPITQSVPQEPRQPWFRGRTFLHESIIGEDSDE